MEKPKPYQQELYDFQQRCRDFMNEHIVQSNKLFEEAEKVKLENSEELANMRCRFMALKDQEKTLWNTSEALKNALNDKYRLQDRVEQLESGFRGWLRRLWAKGGE